MKILFLGTASNGGWPQQDCRCDNCQRARKNRRLRRKRSSLAFSDDGLKWSIIDTGPDFRQQLIDHNWLIQDIDQITFTHLHPDHSSGLVELGMGKPHNVKVAIDETMKRELRRNRQFEHLFRWRFADMVTPSNFKALPIFHWPNHQSRAIIFGGKKSCMFISDCAKIDKRLQEEMKKVSLIIFDGTFLNESKHNHLSIRKSCPILKEVGVPVIFTHINHSEDAVKVRRFVKSFGFKLAHDGLEIDMADIISL